MKEQDDIRVLGALRLRDAVTRAIIEQPLKVSCAAASLRRSLSGLYIIATAPGLEKYTSVFDLVDLAPTDVKPDGSVALDGRVEDPMGSYLPRAFSVTLPRNGTAGSPHPANSLFEPVELQLLPSPSAKVMAGWAQVRVTVKKSTREAFPNVLVRAVAVADNRVLGRGMSDSRGEALVAIPGLPLFQAGTTPDKVVTSETAARIEFVPPANADPFVDWSTLDALPAVSANVASAPLPLKTGESFSLQFSVTA